MNEELLLMSVSECNRLEIIQQVLGKRLKQVDAAKRLGITSRQVRNLQASYLREGPAGLISRRRGRPSNNQLTESVRTEARALILSHYSDFGPTLAHEKLTEVHGLKLSIESVRQLMIRMAMWHGKRRRVARIHQMRPRRSRFGELIQIDGSHHAWFESRGPTCCLHVFIDDATGRITSLRFAEQEDTQAYFDALRYHLKQHGRPLSLYSDKHGIFRVNIAEAKKSTGETQFSRAMRALDIELICANTPQAKGRVEKANGTLQDRLIIALRLRGISDIDTANAFMPLYIKLYNKRFAKPARDAQDAHLKTVPTPGVLDLILSHQENRKISKNLEVSYKNVLYQIQTKKPSYNMRGASVTVCDMKGKVTILYKNKPLTYKTMDKQNQTTPIVTSKQLEHTRKASNYKPPATHPWRRYQLCTDKKQNKARI